MNIRKITFYFICLIAVFLVFHHPDGIVSFGMSVIDAASRLADAIASQLGA
jgi:hypothetical protein